MYLAERIRSDIILDKSQVIEEFCRGQSEIEKKEMTLELQYIANPREIYDYEAFLSV